MTDEQLKRRVEALREDFAAETGKPFEHFFCPILNTDEPAPLCKGHVVPEKLGACNVWVPQRADIDNFYGSAAEADFIAVVQDRSKTPFEKWLDPTLRKRHRPRFQFEGKPIGHYFSKAGEHAPGHTPVQIIGTGGQSICNVVVKMTPEEMLTLHGKDLRIVVERDYRPALVASLLKAAHLTLFQMLGYRHLFAPDGYYLAHILRDFYVAHRETPRRELEEVLGSYFRPLACMISPMMVKDPSVLQGTVTDNRMLACIGGSQGVFAIGVVVKAANDMFCVFLPPEDGKNYDTYFGFLKEPPPSFAVRMIQFHRADARNESYWAVSAGEPLRIPLLEKLPQH